MKELAPEHIKALMPYQPGKPIEETERELGLSGVIKLASNENPLGPSPLAIAAVRSHLAESHRYPEGSCFYLRRRLAEVLGLDEGLLIFGNGTNELIEIIVRTFVMPGEEVVLSEASFIVYQLISHAAGHKFHSLPMRDYNFDLKAMAGAVNERTKAVFIANPNNPTGTYVGRTEFEEFLDAVPREVIVVMDEAYFEYVTADDYPDSLRYHDHHPRLVTLRTFSKIYGLAGLRVGYAVADRELIDLMNRVRQPFNVNRLAQVAACAALDDAEFVERARRLNREGMVFLEQELPALGVKVIPSQANFILVDLQRDGVELYQLLLRQGVTVRPMKGYGLPTCVRITVGTMEENRRLVQAMKEVLGK